MKKTVVAMFLLAQAAAWEPGAVYGQGGVGYLRAIDIPAGLKRTVRLLGDRLQRPGKERVELTGTLARVGSGSVAVRVIWEFPGRIRLEEGAGSGVEVLTYDGESLTNSRGLVGVEDEDLIETLIHDSVEGFFIGQRQGLATRFLGSRIQQEDESGEPVGPYYELYEVTGRLRVLGGVFRQPKRYYFNSDTGLLDRVSYWLKPERGRSEIQVDVLWNHWGWVVRDGFAGQMVRYENGVEVLRLEIETAGAVPLPADGVVSSPGGDR